MPDQQNNQGPWGQRQDKGPPDLLDLIARFFQGKTSQGSGGSNSEHFGKYLSLLAVGLVVLWALTGIFLVSPAEQAVVTRFGQYEATVGPGPHWIPRIIESETTLNVQQVSNFSPQPAEEMLTKDENIVSISLAVQYRIADPKSYLFNVVDPVTTLKQVTSSALRQAAGQMTLDSILTTGRSKLRDAIAQQLEHTLAAYQTGLEITDVTLQPAKPPEAVTHAFDDAIKAREDEQRYINRAQAYARRVVSIAKGHVARLQKSAAAYQQSVVLKANGDTARYLALLKPYEASPAVTGERLYLDAMSNVLSKTSNIVVDSSGTNVLYLPLEQILKHQGNQKMHILSSKINQDDQKKYAGEGS
jgi:modulator of FtsH protease HflK